MSVKSGTFAGAILIASVAGLLPVVAAEMNAEEAKHFVSGKLFAYTCFEGTTGAGRIFSDGSVVGSIQIRGQGPVRYVALPAGTLKVKGDNYCASMRGLPFEPCFNVDKTSHSSFRGSVWGFGFAYCDFTRRSARIDLAGAPLRLTPLQSSSSSAPKSVETVERGNADRNN
jgi:hypothetical protein